MRTNDYPGPRIIGRGGPGMAGWVWVAPGVPQPSTAAHSEPAQAVFQECESAAADRTNSDSAVPSEGTPDRSSPGNATVRIKVIGPVEVEPWLNAPTRSKVIEAACFLALHRRRPVTTEELQIARSSDDDGPETSAKSVRTYVSDLRRSLGAMHVPSARGSGYRLADSVTCDWEDIQELAARRPADTADQFWALGNALNMVRGRPFEGARYRWVDSELLVSEMEVTIGDVARRLGEIARAHDEMEGVLWFAGRRAALACPYDLVLWEMALEGAAGYDRNELTRTWHDAQVTLGDEAAALSDLAQRLGLL
jgi:hypothetical protein